MQSIDEIFGKFFKKKPIYNGASLLYTPILIGILLLCKGVFFKLNKKYENLQTDIKNEKVIQSSLAFEFAKHQNHKKILDLKEKYFPHYTNINAKHIIKENQIETFDNIKNDN